MTVDQQRLMDYLPELYAIDVTTNSMMSVESTEIESWKLAIADALLQRFVSSSTWGLDKWEAMANLPVNPLGKTLAERRGLINSRRRSSGTATKAMIQSVANSFDNGDVTVTENIASYTVVITFISNNGVPSNITDIQTALRQIVPAHLDVTYAFKYLTFGQWSAQNKTFAQMDALGFTFAQLESWNP